MRNEICKNCGTNSWKRKSTPRKDGSYGYDCICCYKAGQKRYYYKYPERQRSKRVRAKGRFKDCVLRRTYNITLEEFEAMLKAQSHLCKICGKPETAVHSKSKEPKQLNVDHCHTTGKVRGLLCTSCNFSLGGFQDDINLLQKAIEYLKSD